MIIIIVIAIRRQQKQRRDAEAEEAAKQKQTELLMVMPNKRSSFTSSVLPPANPHLTANSDTAPKDDEAFDEFNSKDFDDALSQLEANMSELQTMTNELDEPTGADGKKGRKSIRKSVRGSGGDGGGGARGSTREDDTGDNGGNRGSVRKSVSVRNADLARENSKRMFSDPLDEIE
jgi:hypothetical protein